MLGFRLDLHFRKRGVPLKGLGVDPDNIPLPNLVILLLLLLQNLAYPRLHMLPQTLLAPVDNLHKVFLHVYYLSLCLVLYPLRQGLHLLHLLCYSLLLLLHFVLLFAVELLVA